MPVRQENDAWVRDCPACGKAVRCSGKHNALAADRKGRKCKACARLPENNPQFGKTGELNPFYGKKHTPETKAKFRLRSTAHSQTDEFRLKMRKVWEDHHAGKERLSNYEYWKKKYGIEEATRRLDELRSKQSLASTGANNPMYGKPAPMGAGYGWKGWLDGKFFRSLRELRFMLDNPTAVSGESSEWTAAFTFNGSERTTRPDFVVHSTKTVFECKPERLIGTPQVEAKRAAMEKLVAARGYNYCVVDPGIVQLKDLTSLIVCGRVMLADKTKELYEKCLP